MNAELCPHNTSPVNESRESDSEEEDLEEVNLDPDFGLVHETQTAATNNNLDEVNLLNLEDSEPQEMETSVIEMASNSSTSSSPSPTPLPNNNTNYLCVVPPAPTSYDKVVAAVAHPHRRRKGSPCQLVFYASVVDRPPTSDNKSMTPYQPPYGQCTHPSSSSSCSYPCYSVWMDRMQHHYHVKEEALTTPPSDRGVFRVSQSQLKGLIHPSAESADRLSSPSTRRRPKLSYFFVTRRQPMSPET